MSQQTAPLSLVILHKQEKLSLILDVLKTHNITVDNFSTEAWQSSHSLIDSPDILYIESNRTPVDLIEMMSSQYNLSNSLVIVNDSHVHQSLRLPNINAVYQWPLEQASILDYLNTQCARQNQTNEIQSIREEFVNLNLIGSSPVFLETLVKLKKISKYDAPVLICGETGTGKEMVARAIHYLGGRNENPFIPVDCGAIPDNLVENELFGHERGAYTDARQSQHGLIAQAESGTLFLDEVDALSYKAQVTLLRFLQTREFRPLGSQQSQASNIRIITATNADLKAMVADGQFRQDLLFRIDVLSLDLPPLRQRIGDINVLANYFLKAFCRSYDRSDCSLHNDTIQWMNQYQWPGNVRELENFIHREFLFSEDGLIKSGDISNTHNPERRRCTDRRSIVSTNLPFNEAKTKCILEFEKKYLFQLMQQSGGNVSEAARIAGKERRSLGKLLKKHGIEKDEFRSS